MAANGEYAARRRRFNALKVGFAALRQRSEAAVPARGAAIEAAWPSLIADLIEEPLMSGHNPGAVLVPGTPFTEAGVRRLLADLEARVAAPGLSGRAIVAGMLIKALKAPPSPGRSMIAGANPACLQWLAILLDRVRAADSWSQLPSQPSGSRQ